MMFAMVGVSMPNFWIGLDDDRVLLGPARLAADRRLRAVLPGSWGWLRSTTMPAVSLALLQIGLLARITRSTMLEVLRQDHIRTARAKGLPNYLVKARVANTMIPGCHRDRHHRQPADFRRGRHRSRCPDLGVGQLLTSAILNRDYPMIQGGLPVRHPAAGRTTSWSMSPMPGSIRA